MSPVIFRAMLLGFLLHRTPARLMRAVQAATPAVWGWAFSVLGVGGAVAGVGVANTTEAYIEDAAHLTATTGDISITAEGNLDIRSSIATADEYEKLAQAFNHMLDHLQVAQEDLREANRQLDAKIAELQQAQLREAQQRETLRGELFRRVVAAQEAERQRIARDLHDDTSQALSALLLLTVSIALLSFSMRAH